MRFALHILLLLSPAAAHADWCSADMPAGEKCRVHLKDLRPSQGAVGMRKVREKMAEYDDIGSKEDLKKELKEKRVRVVIGPGDTFYLIDGHHQARALHELDEKRVYAVIEANLSQLSEEEFWQRMESNHWARLKDQHGEVIKPSELPKNLSQLKDDPYRALAGDVIESGAVRDLSRPMFDFEWADHFRERISREELKDWDGAVKKAIDLALSSKASDLPGHFDIVPHRLSLKRDACWEKYQALAQ